MTYKNTLISLLMMAAIALAAWMTLASNHSTVAAADEKTTFLPDAFMEEVTSIIMDKQGKPSMKIVSPRMVHYTQNDTTHFASPELTLYRKSPTPWYVTSKQAKATDGITHVDFWQDVVIHHAADIDHPATLIKTPALTVYPNEHTAETAERIVLIQPNLTVRAIGMHANLKTGDIKLLSQAKGEYVPQD